MLGLAASAAGMLPDILPAMSTFTDFLEARASAPRELQETHAWLERGKKVYDQATGQFSEELTQPLAMTLSHAVRLYVEAKGDIEKKRPSMGAHTSKLDEMQDKIDKQIQMLVSMGLQIEPTKQVSDVTGYASQCEDVGRTKDHADGIPTVGLPGDEGGVLGEQPKANPQSLPEEEVLPLSSKPTEVLRGPIQARLPLKEQELESLCDAIEDALEDDQLIGDLGKELSKLLEIFRSCPKHHILQTTVTWIMQCMMEKWPASVDGLQQICGSADYWVKLLTRVGSMKEVKETRRKNVMNKFEEYAKNYLSRATEVLERLKEAGISWPVPEVINYAPILLAEPEGMQCFEDLQRELARVESDNAKASEAKQNINEHLLPRSQDTSPNLCQKWIAHNRNAKGHHWIQEPLPDWSVAEFRQDQLARLHDLLQNMPEFCLIDYNRVFDGKERTEIGKIIEDWAKHPTAGIKLHTVFSIVLNLLRRREDWVDFIEILKKHVVKNAELTVLSGMLNPKGLFFILFQCSENQLKAKLLRDFATHHAVPLVMYTWSEAPPKMVMNPFVYHVIHESVGVLSLAVGAKAAKARSGKTQLVNNVFGTSFTCDEASFLTYGSVDLDTGAAFNPDRRIAVADSHGRFNLQFSNALLNMFSYLVVQANAQELFDSTAAICQDLMQLKHALAQGPHGRPWEGRHIFFLIRDADYITGTAFCNDSGTIMHKFPVMADFKELQGDLHQGDQQLHFLSIPDLRNRNGGQIQSDQLRPAILKLVTADAAAVIANREQWQHKREHPTLGSLVYRLGEADRATFSPAELPLLGTGAEAPANKEVAERPAPILPKLLTKKAFVDTAIRHACPEFHESYEEMEQHVASILSELQTWQDDFFQTGALPVRSALSELRTVEKKMRDTDMMKDDLVNKEVQAEHEAILAKLKGAQLTPLLQKFLNALSTYNAATILCEIGSQIKLQNKPNVAEEQRLKLLLHNLTVPRNLPDEKFQKLIGVKDEWLKELDRQIDRRSFSVEVLFRELNFLREFTQQQVFHVPGELGDVNPALIEQDFLMAGEPFELIDGDNLKFPTAALAEMFRQVEADCVFVISVLGPQSSGKSTLLNFLFGSTFATDTGRCTKGIYGTLIKVEHDHYQYILILDTEGLQSTEKSDQEFDRKISLFAMAVSNLELINLKGELHKPIKSLLEICAVSLQRLERAKMNVPLIQYVFNQNSDKDPTPFRKQLEGMLKQVTDAVPDAKEVAHVLEAPDQDLFVLGFAYKEETQNRKEDQGQDMAWTVQRPSSTFAEDVSQITARLNEVMTQGYDQVKKDGTAAWLMHLGDWLETAADNWTAIDENPDLVKYEDLTHLAHDRELGNKLIEWENLHLRGDVASYDRLVIELTNALDKDKLANEDYLSEQVHKMRMSVDELFEGKRAVLQKELEGAAKEREYNARLKDQYARKLDLSIDTNHKETMQKIYVAIQKMKAQQGRCSGQFELEQKMQEMIKKGDVVSRDEALQAFGDQWEKMIKKRSEELKFEDMEDALYDAMKAAYKSESLHKHEQVLCANILESPKTQSTLRQYATQDMAKENGVSDRVASHLSQTYMNSPEKLFQFAREPQRFALALQNSATRCNLLQILGKAPYLNVMDCMKPVSIAYAFDPSTLPSHVDWTLVKTTLLNILKYRMSRRLIGRKQEMDTFLNSFNYLHGDFIPDFKQKLQQLAHESEFDCTRKLKLILSRYTCFQEPMRFPMERVGQCLCPGLYTDWEQLFLTDFCMMLGVRCRKLAQHDAGHEEAVLVIDHLDGVLQKQNFKLELKFKKKVQNAMRGGWISSPTDQLEEVLQEYSCFEAQLPHPLSVITELCRYPSLEVLKQQAKAILKPGTGYVREFRVDLTAPNFAERPVIDSKLVRLQDVIVELQPKDEFKDSSMGLNYLNDHLHMTPAEQGIAFKELRNLAARQLKAGGGWVKVMESLKEEIEDVINLRDTNTTSISESISSFSAALISNVSTRVHCFITKVLDGSFARFGLRLTMDGFSVLHYFALLHSWRMLANGQRDRALTDIRAMERDYPHYRDYFVSNVCADHIGASRNAASRFVSRVVDIFAAEKQSLAATNVQSALRARGAMFNACKIQCDLDEDLIFRGTEGNPEVIKYITQQTQYLEGYFVTLFSKEFGKLAEPEVQAARKLLEEGLREMKHSLQELNNFLAANDMTEMLSERLLQGADNTAVWRQDGTKNQQAYSLICDFLKGRSIADWSQRLADFKFTRTVGIVDVLPEPAVKPRVPVLFAFCTEALQIIDRVSSDTTISWGQRELEVDQVFQDLKRDSIGCPAECPTCGRKCDAIAGHNLPHQCSAGHQIRGMKGVHLENGAASVECCNEIDDRRRIRVHKNGQWVMKTWAKVKEDVPEWCYDSGTIEPNRISKLRRAWNAVGECICEHYQTQEGIPIKFIKYNVNDIIPATHYILLLDESSSMRGSRWNHAVQAAIAFVKGMNYDRMDRPSVVFFNQTWREIIHVGAKSSVNAIRDAGFSGGRTSFAAALQGAICMIRQCDAKTDVELNRHVILHYTDGEAEFPQSGVGELMELQNAGVSLCYYAISELPENPSLTQIAQALHPLDSEEHVKRSIRPDMLSQALEEVLRM